VPATILGRQSSVHHQYIKEYTYANISKPAYQPMLPHKTEAVMNLKRLFVVGAVLSLLFGAGFALNPQLVIEQHGMTANDGFRMMMRVMGAALLGYAMIFWSVRNAQASATLTAIVRGSFLFHLIAFGATTHGITTGVLNTMGLGPVLIHLGLAFGFGYYSFRTVAATGGSATA
jgi:hypothetical protein